MQVGKLYKLSRYFFLLYKTTDDSLSHYISAELSEKCAKATCGAYSEEILSHMNPETILLCLECVPIGNRYASIMYKVLTCEGETGWVMIHEWGKECCIEQSKPEVI